MATCDNCGKPLNRQINEVNSLCVDCIKSRSGSNTYKMKKTRDSIKKNKRRALIFAAIFAVVITITFTFYGVFMEGGGMGFFIFFISGGIFIGIWVGVGVGTSLSQIEFENFFEGFFVNAFYLIISFFVGFFGGLILFLIIILRRNKWIKDLDAIIASENAAIAELDGYILGKNINKEDLKRKINIIRDNYRSNIGSDNLILIEEDLKTKKLRIVK